MRCDSAHDVSLIMNPGYSADYTFDRAGVYEIHVVGLVDSSQSDYLAGMTGRRLDCADDSKPPVTVLTGWLPDQAALNAGVTSSGGTPPDRRDPPPGRGPTA